MLEKLVDVWGPYAALGYTNNEENVEGCLNIVHKPEASETSFHVYFYDAKMSRSEAHKLHSEFKALNHETFKYDASVYKQAGKQQVFRCPLSYKIDYIPGKAPLFHMEKRVACPECSIPEWYVTQSTATSHAQPHSTIWPTYWERAQ
jgi:hypothetical protein